jgi:hypothetical protein
MSTVERRTRTASQDQVQRWLDQAGEAAPVTRRSAEVVRATARTPARARTAALRVHPRQGVQPARWSVRRRLAVGTAVAAPVLAVVVWVAYEVWAYRYFILGLLVVAALLAGRAAVGSTRGGRGVIGLFERGTVRWFDER